MKKSMVFVFGLALLLIQPAFAERSCTGAELAGGKVVGPAATDSGSDALGPGEYGNTRSKPALENFETIHVGPAVAETISPDGQGPAVADLEIINLGTDKSNSLWASLIDKVITFVDSGSDALGKKVATRDYTGPVLGDMAESGPISHPCGDCITIAADGSVSGMIPLAADVMGNNGIAVPPTEVGLLIVEHDTPGAGAIDSDNPCFGNEQQPCFGHKDGGVTDLRNWVTDLHM